jgi:hypothetical protein
MKAVFLPLLFTALISNAQSGVDSTGLPGDQFSLQGALAMFKKAGSPEEFEKLINAEENSVNNLDLNGDGETDYIRVISHREGDLHAFVLQVPVSEKESQDIAVIELEKTGDESAIIQIVGDEEIFGEQVMVEPEGGSTTAAFLLNEEQALASGPSMPEYEFAAAPIVVNVWLWPSVRFVYAPAYRPWISPWRWRHYPAWWRPWRPIGWHVWHPRVRVYHRPFVVAPVLRVTRVHRVYSPLRVSSVSVRSRHAVAVNNYRVTRTRTTVTGPRGNKVTRTSTTVRGKNGKVKKTRVRRH